jgi:hypothetical protein
VTTEASTTALDALRERWDKPIGRPCLDCNACCDHFEIEEIEKASKQRCPLLKAVGGCSVHATADMPKACSRYACVWAMGYGKPKDRPDKSGVIVDFRDGSEGDGLYGHVLGDVDEGNVMKLHNAVLRISEMSGLPVHFEEAGTVNLKKAG